MGIINSIAYSIIPVTGGKGHNREYFKHEHLTLSEDILVMLRVRTILDCENDSSKKQENKMRLGIWKWLSQ